MGHLVGKDGVRVDPKKIEVMQDWPHPKTLKSLRGFLGLTRYYRKFVQNYGKIVEPLIAPQKELFHLDSSHFSRFSNLEDGHVHRSVPLPSQFHKDFVLECDASRKGIGVVLMQEGQP